MPDGVHAALHRRGYVRAVIAHPVETHAARQPIDKHLVDLAQAVHRLRRIRLAALRHAHQDGGTSVERGDRLLALRAERKRRDVAQVDPRAAHGSDLDPPEVLDAARLGVEHDGELARMVRELSRRYLEVALADRVDDLRERETAGRELRAVHGHDDFALLAADQLDRRDARDGREPPRQPVVRIVVELVDGLLARQRERDDGDRVHVELLDLRFLGAARQVALDRRDLRADVVRRDVLVHVEVELEHDLAEVVRARRRHVLEAVYLHRGVLDGARDGRLDLLGRRARIDDDDRHVGHDDVRHDVDAHVPRRERSEEHQHDQDDERQDRPADGGIRENHLASSPRRPRSRAACPRE